MSLAQVLKSRRDRLARLIDFPVILWSGGVLARNFPANTYPFRASSHFLYFAGLHLENAAIRLYQGNLELFLNPVPSSSLLWHGPLPSPQEIAELIGADRLYPMNVLPLHATGAATIPVQDVKTYQKQVLILDRSIPSGAQLAGLDRELAAALVSLRLRHDTAALTEIRRAAAVTTRAHAIVRQQLPAAKTEAEVRSIIESTFIAANMSCAYPSIVTTHGEILHNNRYDHELHPGDLLLIDAGAETETGWASDVTRTWPVSGQFSASQQAIYDIVLAAHDRCVAKVAPGVEYQEIHMEAALVIAAGLVDLKILRGRPAELIEMDAHTLFFPHGIGHLLGLDVHDMEDLGDLAGYAPGRARSDRPGLKFLRLHRPLQPGMVVTIEPGFYRIPALLQSFPYPELINWDKLAQFNDVRGIRIENDILVTETGHENLTASQ